MEETKKSTSVVEVVPVTLEKHPNADTLSVVPIFGYTYVARTADWQGVTKAAWVPPDNVVDTTRPEFAWLVDKAKPDGSYRVRAAKLRGIVSFGILVPVPDDTPLGEDWADKLEVTHYDPPTQQDKRGGLCGGEATSAPPGVRIPKYDLDAFRRYGKSCFVDGEPVIVTEKIHGANARYTYVDGEFHCGSKSEWKRRYPDLTHYTVENMLARSKGKLTEEAAKEIVERIHSKPQQLNMWWQVLDSNPELQRFLKDNPGFVVYGEVYGQVQDLKYGTKQNEIRFAAFDILDGNTGRGFLDHYDARDMADGYDFEWVPYVNSDGGEGGLHGYDFNALCELAEGKSLVPGANHIREGVVVSPVKERNHHHIGRVKLKIVSPTYLERAK